MKVIIVGCGRLGSELAYLLFKHGNEVAIIDKDKTAFEILKPDFRGHIVEGDVLSQDVLNELELKQRMRLQLQPVPILSIWWPAV